MILIRVVFFLFIMSKKKLLNYKDTFMFPDIPGQIYPVYALSKNEKIINFKSIIYPTPRSIKRFTRNKQLRYRSKQAAMFDCLINIGYFGGLEVWREFPVLIQNSKRIEGQDEGLYYMCDYYIPALKLAVELDSDLHLPEKDRIRDKYLNTAYGINVFRMEGFDKPVVQKNRFKELVKLLRETKPLDNYQPFCFTEDLYKWIDKNHPE